MEIFDDYKLNEIDEGWVKSICDNGFSIFPETQDIETFIQNEDMEFLLKTSCIAVKETSQNPQIFWEIIVTNGIKLSNLLALLGYLMKHGQSTFADENSRQSSIKATTLYFSLLGIPGSNAFNVFHVNLYRKALETLQLSKLLTTAGYDEEHQLSVSQKVVLIRSLNNLMYELTLMIKSFWFKEHSQSLEDTIRILMEITQMESYQFETRLKRTEASLTSLSHNAYCVLQELCDTKHGPPNLTVTLIVQCTLSQFLFNNQTKTHIKTQESCINFLESLLKSHKEETSSAMLILIQHLMFKCPDRLEGRQKQAMFLIKLILICQEKLSLEIIKNLILLTHNQKVSHRIFAQEITGQLLIERSLARHKIQQILISMVLSRCNDNSSMVRGRAMSTLSEITDRDSILKDILSVSNLDEEFPTLEELIESVSKNTNPIPGFNKILSTLTGRIQDERALVRKSTLHVLKNLAMHSSNYLQQISKLISLRCRDPAILVRGTAIQILTDLLEKYPNDKNLLNHWIESVIPQIYDIEPKIQEKVLKSLENLLLDGIRDPNNSLPWNILKQMITLKMRKHLSKICYFWVKNATMTNRIIKNIRSYLDTENNINAWAFLVAISAHRQLDLKDYPIPINEIFHENNFHSSLVLEVLRNSYDNLTNEQLQALRDELNNSLSGLSVALPLISVSLDIFYRLSDSQMDIINLMKSSEDEIENAFRQNYRDDVRCLRAMTTLGHVSYFTNRQIPLKIIRILQAILFDQDLIKLKELRPTVIVVLAQQSMRDRGLAKQMIPIFGELLQKKQTDLDETPVRVNSAKALADLCKRFTALVEPYLSDMCLRMKDSNPIVRESIVVIFIQLLLEDYIKLKGPFFFHILTMLSDEDKIIRELTIFLVEERLLTKNKNLIQQRFIESIYHYNNFRESSHEKFVESEEILLLPGPSNYEKRKVIYDFLLDRLDPPGKLKILVKLTSRVNNFAFSNDLTMDLKNEEPSCTLKDILSILSSDYFQPSSIGKQGHEDNNHDQEETITATANNVIVEGMKRHIVHVLLPSLMKLKLKLKTFKAFYNDVQSMINTILHDHKDLISADEFPELEKQIEIDHAIVEDASAGKNPRILLRRLSSLTYSNRTQEPGPSRK